MSTFVVSEWTMHRCVAALDEYESSCDRMDVLGQQLFKLNERAVAVRYNEKPNDAMSSTYRFRPVGSPCIFQTLKSLECLRYQCAEGDVPDDLLFKRIDDKVNEVRGKIVRSLPQYEAAGWDGPNVQAKTAGGAW